MDKTGDYYTEWSKSERKTPIEYINTYIYEFRKMVMMTLYARQQKRHRCKEEDCGLCGKSKGGMIWQTSFETCILSCVN